MATSGPAMLDQDESRGGQRGEEEGERGGKGREGGKGRGRVGRLFVLMHFKEVGLAVDTSKLLLLAYPPAAVPSDSQPLWGAGTAGAPTVSEGSVGDAWLVVGGIGRLDQEAMEMMLASCEAGNALVLFSLKDAVTFDELCTTKRLGEPVLGGEREAGGQGGRSWDVVVIDGTWAQARKLLATLPALAACPKVRLSDAAVAEIGSDKSRESCSSTGRQLRHHPIAWREVSVLQAIPMIGF